MSVIRTLRFISVDNDRLSIFAAWSTRILNALEAHVPLTTDTQKAGTRRALTGGLALRLHNFEPQSATEFGSNAKHGSRPDEMEESKR